MSSGEKSFIIADWIFVIGITPFAYFFAYLILVSMLNSFLTTIIPEWYGVTNSSQFFLFVTIATIIGFLITLTYVIKNKIQKNKKTIPMKKTTDKFSSGVFLIYTGHLGLVVIYALLLYITISPGGTASGLFAAPAIPWMLIFYSIGYSIVNKQKLLERFRENNELERHT